MQYTPVDVECYRNFFTVGALLGGRVWRVSVRGMYSRMAAVDVARLCDFLSKTQIVTFNGRNYDEWLISAAIEGRSCNELKEISDKIIVQRVRPWDLGIARLRCRRHVDVMEVIPMPGGQKYLAGVLHFENMQDLPIDPDTLLSDDQMSEIEAYNENDLRQLHTLTGSMSGQLDLRDKLSEKYGVDLRSKSDAQIAETVIRRNCEKAVGRRIYKTPVDWGLSFNFDVPAHIKPTPGGALESLVRRVSEITFYLGAAGKIDGSGLQDATVVIGGKEYAVGIGGLHSTERCESHYSDDRMCLIDMDVASYYPSLMLAAGAYPDALGRQFIVELQALVDARLRAKRICADPTVSAAERADAEVANAGGKVMVTGTFGKTSSPYSILFAPKLMIQTTIGGQLALLMLIERLADVGIRVVSANTDGITVHVPVERFGELSKIRQKWEQECSLKMECVPYKSIHVDGVNSYVAVYYNGKAKRKGDFAKTSIYSKKAPDCEICADAAVAWFLKKTPVEKTIKECTDIRKFLKLSKLSGTADKWHGMVLRSDAKVRGIEPLLPGLGWTKVGRRWTRGDESLKALEAYTASFPPPIVEPVGKVVRWYYATNCPGPLVVRERNARVADSDNARPCMRLPSELPQDIDYDYYIERARKMIALTGIDIQNGSTP